MMASEILPATVEDVEPTPALEQLREIIAELQMSDKESLPELTDEFAEVCARVAEEQGWDPDRLAHEIDTMRMAVE